MNDESFDSLQQSHRPRILMVDDEVSNLLLLEGLLYGESFEVVKAIGGLEALEVIKVSPPDLVLLDIVMQDISGIETCQRIKSNPNTRMIPVVMITALSEVSDRVDAINAGADDFLTKPIEAPELIARVRALLQVRRIYLDKERIVAERLRFMSGIAHNIRSPLTSLALNLYWLKRQLPSDDDKVQEMWERVNATVDHVRSLVTDVMSYYKIETGQMRLNLTSVRLADIVETAYNIAKPLAAEANIRMEIERVPDMYLLVDQNMIVQILLNLLTNAIKYNRPQGSITVRFYNLSVKPYALSALHFPPILTLPPQGIVVDIEDNGIGIQSSDFGRVFSEFDRIHQDDGLDGMGLGLAVSRRLTHLHGGELWFMSQWGEGSTFSLFLPLEAQAGSS